MADTSIRTRAPSANPPSPFDPAAWLERFQTTTGGRPALVALITAAIDMLDLLDGDPDTEDDDPVGQCDEDGINTSSTGYHGVLWAASGPGCEISDTGVVA